MKYESILPTAKNILFTHVPALRDEYLKEGEKEWRDSIIRAMMHYAEIIRDEQRKVTAMHINLRNVPKVKVEHG